MVFYVYSLQERILSCRLWLSIYFVIRFLDFTKRTSLLCSEISVVIKITIGNKLNYQDYYYHFIGVMILKFLSYMFEGACGSIERSVVFGRVSFGTSQVRIPFGPFLFTSRIYLVRYEFALYFFYQFSILVNIFLNQVLQKKLGSIFKMFSVLDILKRNKDSMLCVLIYVLATTLLNYQL